MSGPSWTPSEEADLLATLPLGVQRGREYYDSFISQDPGVNSRRSFEGWRNKARILRGGSESAGLEKSFEGAEGIEFTEDGNWADAKSVSTQIQTLEQLIEACKVDLAVWKVFDWNVKAYDGWRADTEKDLTFDEGKISGHVRSGGIATKTIWSIYAKFVRKVVVPITPTFQPIVCPIEYAEPPEIQHGSVTRALVLPDAHIGFAKEIKSAALYPFHDRRALDIALQVAATYQPNLIVILGDWEDMSRWTKRFPADPEFFLATQPALLEGHWWLRRLREFCSNAKIVYLEGNHEKRMRDYIRDQMIEAYDLRRVGDEFPAMSLPHLLDLPGLRVDWIGGYPNDAVYYSTPWLRWEHGDIARKAGATAKQMIEFATSWRVFGHVHRREVVSRTLEDGSNISGVNFGCLCHLDGRVPGSSPEEQWQQGFGVVEFTESLPSPSIEMITIRDGKATWRGTELEGHSNVEALREAFADWNW